MIKDVLIFVCVFAVIELKLLLLEMLQFDPEKRLDVDGVRQHPWCCNEKLNPGNYLYMDAVRFSYRICGLT